MSEPQRLSNRLVAGWGIGSLGASALHNGISFLALYFLSQVLGMPPALAGTLILGAKIYDIFLDPMMGWVSDRTQSRWGRRRPWLAAGAVVSAASLLLLFNPPSTTETGLAVTATVALLLYATGYTLFGIPYMAMPAEMTSDYHERSRLMSARTICLSLGILAGGALAPALVAAFGGGPEGYARMSVVLAALVGFTMLASFAGTAGARFTVREAPHRRGSSAAETGRPVDDSPWRTALANRPFVALIGSKLLHLTGVAISMSSLVFLVTALLGRSEAAMGGFVLASAIGSIGSMPVWLALSRRLGKRNAYLIGVACYLPVLFSWLAASAAEPMVVFLVRGLATGIATGGLTLTAQSMLPDAIEHDYRLSGRRREAMFAAVYSVAEKFASAGGPFLLGLLLGRADSLAPVDGDATVTAVRIAAVFVPAVATALSAVALLFYDLDRLLKPIPDPNA